MNKNINDSEVEKIVAGAKPRISGGDEKFKNVLRSQILSELGRAGMMKEKLTFNEIIMNNLRYWLAGAAVVAVVVIGAFVAVPKKNGGSIALLGSNANVKQVGDKAFGNLSSLSAGTGAQAQAPLAAGTAPTAAGAPTGGGSAAVTNNAAGTATAGAGAIAQGAPSAGAAMAPSMIARPISPPFYYNPQYPNYVYKGDTFTQDQASMDVLKYVVTPISADAATAALAQANLGLNLGSFGTIALQNITLSQSQDYGYTVNIDLTNGTMNIYQNYQTWPQNNDAQPLTAKDMPSDNAILKIANQFMSDHGVALGDYGSPEVVQNNYQYFGADAKGAAIMRPYFSEIVPVLYPLVVNGKTVYDSVGNKTGLNVQVSVRYNRVTGVSGLSTQNYQASAYDAITDTKTILSLAENPQFYPNVYAVPMMGASAGSAGGNTGSAPAPEATITKLQPKAFTTGNEIDFGTPTLGYVSMYDYANGANNQFLVPAYIFPILTTSTSYYYGGSRNIVVPLIADFIQNRNTGIVPPGLPVPLGAPTSANTPATSK